MSKSFKTVGEFEFPESFGFKGSAGKTMVKGYCRGGPAKYAKGGAVKESLVDRAIRKAREDYAAEQADKARVKATPAKEQPTSLEGVIKGKNPFRNAARERALEGYAKGGAVKHEDVKADKKMVAGAVHKHERAMHKGEPETKLAGGGLASRLIGRVKSRQAVPSKPLLVPSQASAAQAAVTEQAERARRVGLFARGARTMGQPKPGSLPVPATSMQPLIGNAPTLARFSRRKPTAS